MPVLYFSKYIIVDKESYYHHLIGVTQRREWKAWIMYMLDAIEITSKLTDQLIDEIVKQMEATLDHGKQHIKWYNKEINETLFAQPYCRTKVISQLVKMRSRTTLNKYMNDLVKAKILSQKKDGNEIYYVNDDLLNILAGQT